MYVRSVDLYALFSLDHNKDQLNKHLLNFWIGKNFLNGNTATVLLERPGYLSLLLYILKLAQDNRSDDNCWAWSSVLWLLVNGVRMARCAS